MNYYKLYICVGLIVWIWCIVAKDEKTTLVDRIILGFFAGIIYPILLCILPFHLFFVEYEIHLKIKLLLKRIKVPNENT